MPELLPGLFVVMTSLAVGIVLIVGFSFGMFDKSSKLWWSGFSTHAVAPAALAFALVLGPAISVSLASLLHLTGVGLEAASLRALDKTRKDGYSSVLVIAGTTTLWLLWTLWSWGNADPVAATMTNSVAEVLIYAWATYSAWRLRQSKKSIYLTQIIVLLTISGVVWVSRIILILSGDVELVTKGDPVSVLSLVVIATCVLLRTYCYLGLRLDALRRFAEREARSVREQSYALGRRNAEIASAMQAVPGSCIVTDASLRIVYANSEACRVLGLDPQSSRTRFESLLVEPRSFTFGDLVHRKEIKVRTVDSPNGRDMLMTASASADEGAATQYVFLLQPMTVDADTRPA